MAFACHLPAQQLGGVNGTVTDTTGAVVPDAKITVESPGSGVVYRSQTSSGGTFLVLNVRPGRYTVTVEAPGFQRFTQTSLIVDTGSTTAVLAKLNPASATASVEVTAANAPLLTAVPDIGTNIEPELWQDLPLVVSGSGRDFRQAAMSNVPGVEYDTSGYGKIGGSQIGAEFNYFNGLPQNSNATMLPPYDFIDEVHVDVTTVDPQWGWGVGALRFQTKFGTNRVHGSVFEINRNSFFDSRGLGNQITPSDHENNFGFSVGGPVVLPKLYHGQNRTFFYFSYEGYVENNASTRTDVTGYTTLPTAAMKQGDFSGLVGNVAGSGIVQIPIYDPQSPDPVHPQQFSCNGVLNVICPERISSTSKTLLQYLPDPYNRGTAGSGPGDLQNNYYYSNNIPNHFNKWGLSIDEHITPNQSINVAMDESRTPFYSNNSPLAFGGYGNTTNPLSSLAVESWPGGFIYGNYVWNIHPSLLLTAGVSIPFDYDHYKRTLAPAKTIPAQQFGGAPVQAFPTVNFAGAYPAWGMGSGSAGQDMKTPYYAAYTNLNWMRGRHTVNIGMQGMYYKFSGWECLGGSGACAGIFNFSGTTTAGNSNGSGSTTFQGAPNTGNPFASYLLGEVDSAQVTYSPPSSVTMNYGAYAVYLHDAFKMTSRLTINAGLRWDIQVPYSTPDNQQDFLSPASLKIDNPAAGGQPGVLTKLGGDCADCSGVSRAAIHWGELAPRAGFSYALNDRTVISGGFSTLWQQYTTNGTYKSVFSNDGEAFGVSNTINGNGTNAAGFGDWDSQVLTWPSTPQFDKTMLTGQDVGYFDPAVDGMNPYYFLWNIGVQRTLPHSWFIRTVYVGQKGTHLVGAPVQNMNVLPEGAPQRYGAGATNILNSSITSSAAAAAGIAAPFSNFSQLWGSAATVARALLPYPQYGAIYKRFPYNGAMKYGSWQTEIDKRYSGGFSLLSGFTLQHDVSNANSMLIWDGAGTGPIDPYNPSTDYALVGPLWMVNIAGTYDLPVGPGKLWLNNKHVTGELLGGWKVAWTQYYGSGSPHPVAASGDPYSTGFGNRADRIPGLPIRFNGYGKVKQWILAGADPASAPVIVQNNGAFTIPGAQNGASLTQSANIPGDSMASYGEIRDPTYMVENVGMEKAFSIVEGVRGTFRADFSNPFNRWYLGGGCVDLNIADGTAADGTLTPDTGNYGRYTNPLCGSGQRKGQFSLRIEF